MSTGASIIKQFSDQFRIILILQLINGISSVLRKFLKYFNGAIVLKNFCAIISCSLAIFVLNLNKALLLLSAEKSGIAPLASRNGSSL